MCQGGGFYSCRSVAIEIGSGFFVPGTEFRVPLLVASLVFV